MRQKSSILLDYLIDYMLGESKMFLSSLELNCYFSFKLFIVLVLIFIYSLFYKHSLVLYLFLNDHIKIVLIYKKCFIHNVYIVWIVLSPPIKIKMTVCADLLILFNAI